ncbi:hypothetical protein [Butyrivibrio sp. VCD2006]|uniref:hypothetical protein n=1 Tax=Butyrivibrio sp. VCD2006 TaxID=1280664 RepID=UPI00040AD26F|nr:hypothetical protein [Butyrivibrio sp. VCD2006]
MMDRRKKLVSLVALLTISAMLVACGDSSAETVDVQENAVAKASAAKTVESAPQKEADKEEVAEEEDSKAADTEAKTEDADAEEAATEEELASKNMLAVKAPGYTGLTNLRTQNNDDGTYYYEDMTEDGLTVITNMCYVNSQRDGQDMDAYAENLVCAQVNSDAVITGSAQDEELSAKLTYPVYKIDYESGENEDTKQAVGVVILTDNFTYYYGYECPIDFFEDNQEFYEEELKNIALIELGDVSGGDFATAYLEKIMEYDKEKTADSYALIYANGSGIPYLAAVNSEGPLDEDGNAHLFTIANGKINEVMSVSSGYDGNHIYVSAGSNAVVQTSGMSGTEIFDLYEFNGKELEGTKELQAVCDLEDDSYKYYDGAVELTEEEYAEAFEESISKNNPYTGIDCDGLNIVNISIKDGYTDFETVKTEKYVSFDDMKKQLLDMGADAEK